MNDYDFLYHKDGNLLNDNADNLEWREFCIENEPAKFIEGYRHKYIITPSGKIYNNFTGKLMKHRLIAGYPHVGLRVYDGKSSTQKLFKVHRLVAEYFLPKVKDKPIVNHIDGNKLNNSLDNLEWATISENTKHSYANKLERNWWTKELGIVCINLIENYKYNFADVAALFNLPSRTYVFHFWNKGYKTFDLKHNNPFIPKHSKKLEISNYYREYIYKLIKDNTMLNNQNKG